jgi:hypothetical protein
MPSGPVEASFDLPAANHRMMKAVHVCFRLAVSKLDHDGASAARNKLTSYGARREAHRRSKA